MWTNWSGGQRAQPRSTVRPLDEAGVVATVQRAAEGGMRIRAVGAGTAWSPLAATDEIALDCSALTGVVSLEPGRVRVRAGATMRQLLAELAEHDLTLAAIPGWDQITVGGATATGAHGSGSEVGSVSSLVRSVRLVDGVGTVRHIEGADLDAVRCGLGALGVLTEVDLVTMPARPLSGSEALRSIDELLAEGFLDTHHWAEFELYPDRQALARWADPVTEEVEQPYGSRVDHVRAAAAGSAQALGRVVPRLAPTLRRSTSRWSGAVTGQPHEVLVTPRPVRAEVTEWALPREALSAALREFDAALRARGIGLRFPIQVRSGAAETGLLHPAYGRRTVWLAVRAQYGTHTEVFGLAQSVFTDAGGRPNWAGRHDWTAADIEVAYPGLERFLAIRNRLDPDRRFGSPYLDALLGH